MANASTEETELLRLRIANLEKFFAIYHPGFAGTLLLEDAIDSSTVITNKAAAKAAMRLEKEKHR